MFRIGEFARISGVSVHALYHYENMQLIAPCHIDGESGYRYYDAGQLVTINKILALKDAGFTLEEIGEILRTNLQVSSLLAVLEEKALTMEELLLQEQSRLERLRTNIFLIKNGGIPMMNEITIKKVEPILVASVRKHFLPDEFNDALEVMWKEVNEAIDVQNGKRTVPCMMLYHIGFWDLGETTKELDVEVIEPISRRLQSTDLMNVYELPAVQRMACVVHQGPFSTLGQTNGRLLDWISQNGYKMTGPLREIYHKGEWVTNNPEEYVTELQAPIE